MHAYSETNMTFFTCGNPMESLDLKGWTFTVRMPNGSEIMGETLWSAKKQDFWFPQITENKAQNDMQKCVAELNEVHKLHSMGTDLSKKDWTAKRRHRSIGSV